MTAKKFIEEQCLQITKGGKHILYPKDLEMLLKYFGKEVCKKQRHICQQEMDKRSVHMRGIWYVACEDVMNAKEPGL